MPESKKKAKARAKKLKMKQSQVVKGESGYFIAPRGVESSAGKKTYASCRSSGKSKEYCAKIAHTVDKQTQNKRKRKRYGKK